MEISMQFSKKARWAIFFGATALMISLGSLNAEAQKRGNKGGEMRGKDRAEQVKEMNGAKEKKEKMAKKGKKEKKVKKGKK
jgi:hypothetical protein